MAAVTSYENALYQTLNFVLKVMRSELLKIVEHLSKSLKLHQGIKIGRLSCYQKNRLIFFPSSFISVVFPEDVGVRLNTTGNLQEEKQQN